MRQGIVVVYVARHVKVVDVLIERLHAFLIAGGHGLLQQADLPFQYEVLYPRGVEEYLYGRDPFPIDGRYEPLGYDGLKVEGELHIYLGMPLDGEKIGIRSRA